MPHAACHDDKCQNATQVDTADLTHLNWHDLRKRSCLPCLATPPLHTSFPVAVTSATVANSSDIQQATAPLQKGNDKQQPKEQRQDADSRRMAWRGKGRRRTEWAWYVGAGRGRRALRLGPMSGAAEGRRMSPCQSCHPRRRRRRCRLLCMQSVE